MLTRPRTSLDSVMWNDYECEKNDVESLVACRRLLLDAGADPTVIVDPTDSYGAFGHALIASKTVSVNLLSLYIVYRLTLL